MFGSKWEANFCASGFEFRRMRTWEVGAMSHFMIITLYGRPGNFIHKVVRMRTWEASEMSHFIIIKLYGRPRYFVHKVMRMRTWELVQCLIII